MLRLVHIGQVPPDPFYDAAVRSMTLSWHNFFFGAFEPGGSVSIDKPPIDLWLQVISVKLLGFSSTTLKLPEAFAGTASVPLLYAVVRRMWSAPAGIAAAVAMAVLPIEVITARSDTMDAVMMLALLLALFAMVRAVETGRSAWLIATAAALGIAFNVKLLESLVALPAIALFAYLGMPGPRLRRLVRLVIPGVVYVAVALSWLTATLLFPAHDRPYAIGSTNGSAWNAAFVFNGTDRLGGKTPEPGAPNSNRAIAIPSPHRRSATTSRSARPPPPACWRGRPPVRRAPRPRDPGRSAAGDPGAAVGSARGSRTARRRDARPRRGSDSGAPPDAPRDCRWVERVDTRGDRAVQPPDPPAPALRGRLHAGRRCDARDRHRLGGVARRPARFSRLRLGALLVTLAAVVYYAERLMYGYPIEWWLTLLGALGAGACALLARTPGLPGRLRPLLAPAGVIALTLVAVLVIPLKADQTAIVDRISDAGLVGQLPGSQQRPLSAYLRAHQDGAYYELAAESATAVGSLIVQDGRPVLVLTTYDARVFTTVSKLEQLIAEGKVRYAFLNTFCAGPDQSVNPPCSAPARWVRAHGTDVSIKAGLPQGGLLYLLPGAKP